MLTKLLYRGFKHAFGLSAAREYLSKLSSLKRFSFYLLCVKCILWMQMSTCIFTQSTKATQESVSQTWGYIFYRWFSFWILKLGITPDAGVVCYLKLTEVFEVSCGQKYLTMLLLSKWNYGLYGQTVNSQWWLRLGFILCRQSKWEQSTCWGCIRYWACLHKTESVVY